MSAPRFKCPCCRSGDTKVTRTVVDVDGAIIRRRRCSDCGHGWYTGQEPEYLVPQNRIGWRKQVNHGYPYLKPTVDQDQ